MQPQGGGVTGWGVGLCALQCQVRIFHPGNLDLAFRPFRPGLGDGVGGEWLHGWLGGWLFGCLGGWLDRWVQPQAHTQAPGPGNR